MPTRSKVCPSASIRLQPWNWSSQGRRGRARRLLRGKSPLIFATRAARPITNRLRIASRCRRSACFQIRSLLRHARPTSCRTGQAMPAARDAISRTASARRPMPQRNWSPYLDSLHRACRFIERYDPGTTQGVIRPDEALSISWRSRPDGHRPAGAQRVRSGFGRGSGRDWQAVDISGALIVIGERRATRMAWTPTFR